MSGDESGINWVSEWEYNAGSWVPCQHVRTFQLSKGQAKLCCYWHHRNPWAFFIIDCEEVFGESSILIGEAMSKTAHFEDVRKRGVSLLCQYLEKNSDAKS